MYIHAFFCRCLSISPALTFLQRYKKKVPSYDGTEWPNELHACMDFYSDHADIFIPEN
jgi:hypothetical protein